MKQANLPAVIFAGGKSSRMGEDKALLPFASYKTLTQYQQERLSTLFSKIYISTKQKNKFDFEANFIEDNPLYDIYAPHVAFLSLFERLSDERVFVISVDMPFVTETIIEKLLACDKPSADATIAHSPYGKEPLCGIYHKSIYKPMLQHYKEQKFRLTQLLDSLNTITVSFEDEEPFTNLNHPSDYHKALQKISN